MPLGHLPEGLTCSVCLPDQLSGTHGGGCGPRVCECMSVGLHACMNTSSSFILSQPKNFSLTSHPLHKGILDFSTGAPALDISSH